MLSGDPCGELTCAGSSIGTRYNAPNTGGCPIQHSRHKDRLRQELTLLNIDRHSGELEKVDVEGILAFAERVLPRASDIWVQASLDQRQRLQQLFFPDGMVFDGKGFVRTGLSTHAFKYLTPDLPAKNDLASPPGFEPGFQP